MIFYHYNNCSRKGTVVSRKGQQYNYKKGVSQVSGCPTSLLIEVLALWLELPKYCAKMIIYLLFEKYCFFRWTVTKNQITVTKLLFCLCGNSKIGETAFSNCKNNLLLMQLMKHKFVRISEAAFIR